ncbi:AP2 domain-containing protein [Neobacillus cucumis]|uniref:AP2 domain-containing protein n=1 Tax=Neobacillus cucumis TaxID=1740721 RepID=A0A2N5HEV5_9BACI|nr:AP2 domain-containing protein [Neobacillus cucumis]PLS04037.1 AP2 domain-containing protein [Neobacillus cucumis]
MEIVKYNNASDIVVRFIDTNSLVKCTYGNFKIGSVRDFYDKTICEVGYIGQGKYNVTENGEVTKVYKVWSSMLNRAYNAKYHKRNPSYKDVTVCQDWHSFQNFGECFDENYYEVDGEKMNLDKDILFKGNKVYSPDKCCFVPDKLNTLIVTCNSARGSLPIGVTFNKVTRSYQTQSADGKGKVVPLGHYSSPEEAFEVYKNFKENVIKHIANEYKNVIPEKLYHALYNWKIEIYD